VLPPHRSDGSTEWPMSLTDAEIVGRVDRKPAVDGGSDKALGVPSVKEVDVPEVERRFVLLAE